MADSFGGSMINVIKFVNKENGRYYWLSINRDMLNGYNLTITRGGNRNNLVVMRSFHSQELCKQEMERLSKIRLRRGYEEVA